jgi:hypothetical protein
MNRRYHRVEISNSRQDDSQPNSRDNILERIGAFRPTGRELSYQTLERQEQAQLRREHQQQQEQLRKDHRQQRQQQRKVFKQYRERLEDTFEKEQSNQNREIEALEKELRDFPKKNQKMPLEEQDMHINALRIKIQNRKRNIISLQDTHQLRRDAQKSRNDIWMDQLKDTQEGERNIQASDHEIEMNELAEQQSQRSRPSEVVNFFARRGGFPEYPTPDEE